MPAINKAPTSTRANVASNTANADGGAGRDGGSGAHPSASGPSPLLLVAASVVAASVVLLPAAVPSLGLDDDRRGLAVPGLAVVLRGLRRRHDHTAPALELLHQVLEVRHELLEGDEPVPLVPISLGELLLHDLTDL